jgi:hypothetical protein
VSGGVDVIGNVVSYAAPPNGWSNNTATSATLGSLGFDGDFEVRFTITQNPANGVFVVGLGVEETSSDYRDVDYAFHSANGQLRIRENGTWITNGPAVVIGDVLSLHVGPGTIEYRVNGMLIHTSTYTGSPAFYVDSSFNSGTAGFAVTLAGASAVDNVPITGWTGATGGVSTAGSDIAYSGTPTGWSNSVNSPYLSNLGAADAFEVSFTVNSPTAGAIWIVGLGSTESGPDWRDVDYGLRNDSGTLKIYENGTWRTAAGLLSSGDNLAIAVNGTALEYRLNGVTVFATTIGSPGDFYIDSAFKNGAAQLGSFTLKLQ